MTLVPTSALAQSTRAEALEQLRFERAQKGPLEPTTRLEKIVLRFENQWLQPDALPRQGTFYPRAGSVTVDDTLNVPGFSCTTCPAGHASIAAWMFPPGDSVAHTVVRCGSPSAPSGSPS